MALSFKHLFTSAKAEGVDATKVRTSNWNAEHVMTAAADTLLGSIAGGNVQEISCTAVGRTLIAAADAAAQRTALGLVISTNVQAQNTKLTTIADLVMAANKLNYWTSATAGATTDFTAAGRSMVGAADLAAQKTLLGIGTADSPQLTAVNIGHATDTTLSRVSAGDLQIETNIIYRAGGTDVPLTDGGTGASTAAAARTNLELVGQQTIWVPAAAMISRSTNGAASGTIELATNKIMVKTMDFDTTTQEFVQFAVQMPKSWDLGTVIAQFVWSHPATTVFFGAVWQLQGGAYADDDALDAALGTAQTATDTGGTTDDAYISPETAAITIAGTPAAEDYVIFQVARVPANGSDNLAVDARLHGIKIHYTTNAARDN